MSQYNKCMGGVDRADQILHTYDATRKSYRWFLKVGIHLIQRMCLNAHIVYTVYGGKRNFQSFLMSCVRLFLHETGVGRQPLIRNVSHPSHSHFPSKFPPRGKNVVVFVTLMAELKRQPCIVKFVQESQDFA